MDLFGYFRKYVWNDEKTPYLVSVGRLTRTQARNELFAYSVLLAAFFFVVGMAALLGASVVAGSLIVAIYAFTICSAAVALTAIRHWIAAVICATAPPAILLFLAIDGFSPRLHAIDKILIAAVLMALWAYAIRVVRIARAYEFLGEKPPEDGDGLKG
jgi:hypothetical protein